MNLYLFYVSMHIALLPSNSVEYVLSIAIPVKSLLKHRSFGNPLSVQSRWVDFYMAIMNIDKSEFLENIPSCLIILMVTDNLITFFGCTAKNYIFGIYIIGNWPHCKVSPYAATLECHDLSGTKVANN